MSKTFGAGSGWLLHCWLLPLAYVDVIPQPRSLTCTPALEVQSVNYWIAKVRKIFRVVESIKGFRTEDQTHILLPQLSCLFNHWHCNSILSIDLVNKLLVRVKGLPLPRVTG